MQNRYSKVKIEIIKENSRLIIERVQERDKDVDKQEKK